MIESHIIRIIPPHGRELSLPLPYAPALLPAVISLGSVGNTRQIPKVKIFVRKIFKVRESLRCSSLSPQHN